MSAESITHIFQGLEGQPASCQLTIYRRPNFDVVIVENSEEEDETLAIKRIQTIAAEATQNYGLDPQRTTWISVTPEPINLLGEFRKIPMEWNLEEGFTLPPVGTLWSFLSKAEVEDMIGEIMTS